VLQCVAVCCSVLQCAAVCGSALQCVFQYVAVCYNDYQTRNIHDLNAQSSVCVRVCMFLRVQERKTVCMCVRENVCVCSAFYQIWNLLDWMRKLKSAVE